MSMRCSVLCRRRAARPVRFILGGEISNIYKTGDRTRKVHNVVFAPGFDAVARLQARLERIGNIRSDGRPILGLDSRDLLESLLEADPACKLIPAHIWTPWFSLLGSKSGFDSVEECYGDLTPHIFAVETGLSSDPPMNWRLSQLDGYALVSNSDAHSPEKLGREATLFECELAYGRFLARYVVRARHSQESLTQRKAFRLIRGLPLRRAMIGMLRPSWQRVEFFPEEGKYHFDGPSPAASFLGSTDHTGPQRALLGLRQAGHRRGDASRGGAGRPA